MKDLSVFIWYMIGAMLFFGIWAVVAVVAYLDRPAAVERMGLEPIVGG